MIIVTPDEACEKIAAYVRETGVTRYYGWTVPPGLPPSWSESTSELREIAEELGLISAK